MKQQRRYKEPQDTLWGKFLSGFMAVVFAMSTLTLIPIASAINGEPNEAQIQQQEELADQTSGKDEKAAEPAADEQKLEPVELLSIASVEDEDDADDAAPADVTLKVKAQSATVTYNGKDAATELVVPTGKDVKFTVKAADGFTLGAAAVKLADAKGETTLTPNAGEYTVAADRVADGATIVVTAEAATGSANTDAAEPSTPAPSTELGEKANKVKNAISNFIEKLGGATTFAAVGNGNGNNSGTGTYSDELPDIKNWSLEKVVQYFRVEPISVVMSPGDRFSDHGGDNSKPEHQFLSTNPDVSIDKSTQAQAEIQGIPGQTTIIVHAYKGKNEKDWNYQIFVVTLSDNKEDDAALCYDANGGTGTTLATTGTVNSVVKVSANGFTREGYAFDGWNTEADGTGTAYAVGADYKLTKAMDTLYAQWSKDSIGTTDPTQPDGVADKYQATIKYAAGANGSVTGTTTRVVTLMDGGAYVTEATITPGTEGVTVEPDTGYEFDEWTDSDPETAITAMGGETYTYTANFKGDFTAISATPYEGVFDGAYHTPTVNGTIEGDKVSFSADHRNVTNGPATVTITVTRGAETYTIGSTVTITPRPVVVTANDASKIYGEADPTLTAAVRGIEGNTASGLVGNDTVAYTVSRATGEDAGEYDITATGNAVQGNYAVTYMPATFTITAAGGNVVTADNIAGADGLTKMYDGQVASVEAEAARSGSTLLYSTDGVSFTTQNPVFTNVGSYDVYVMATNPNYEDTPVVRTTVTITPAPVTVTVGNAAKTAGAVDPTFAATVTGLVNGESAGLISYALTRTAGEDAGSYVITAAGDRVQGNYIVTYVPGTLVITAALVPPAALPAGPAAPAAVAALDTILDDGVPLATIDDDENALAAFEEIHCWTHWLMIFGALVTIVYGLAVLYRRRHGIRDMDDFEGDIMGGRKYDAAAEKNPAAGNAFQAM